MTAPLAAPFPYFGGKRKVAADVWSRFGHVDNYVEPFFGSGAVLLGRPGPFRGNETINDLDGFVSNFWRATRADPDAVAEHADYPVIENDLHARHAWLVAHREAIQTNLEGDSEWYDAKVAGWWVWGLSCWIGSGFCSGNGPWSVDATGALVRGESNGQGVKRERPHLGGMGTGVGVHAARARQGVKRQLPHLGDNGITGRGIKSMARIDRLAPLFRDLAERLARVRVCSGDWSRVCGPAVTWKHGTTAVFLDPPYADTADRDPDIYRIDSLTVAHDVREWAIENGERRDMRIALCGYEGEHEMPASWAVHEWSTGGGYGTAEGGRRERIWYSPACLSPRQGSLFARAAR